MGDDKLSTMAGLIKATICLALAVVVLLNTVEAEEECTQTSNYANGCGTLIDKKGPGMCYKAKLRKRCCKMCEGWEIGTGDCLYGDRASNFCRKKTAADCSNPNVKAKC